MMQSDKDLMGRILKRDESAFEALFTRYSETIRLYLLRTVRDENASDDLVQETFLRVWTHAEQWGGQGTFKAWLFRIAMNLALNYLRSVRRRRQQPLEIPSDMEDEEDENPAPSWLIDASALGPDAVLELSERRKLLQGLVDGLPESKREVFRLVHEEEMEIREVAEALEIPQGTVKSRLHYTVKRLAREWKDIETE